MVVAYLRVSTCKQHLENQKEEITRYAFSKRLSVNQWVEETVSGKTNQKFRKLGKVINDLKQGDTLIVTEISRLSRSLHEIMVIMKNCVDTGIIIHSTKDGYIFDDSLNSKVLSFAFGLSAEIEHKLISQRTREALAMRKAAGKHIGRSHGTDYLYQKSIKKKDAIILSIQDGLTISKLCLKFKFSRTVLQKLRNENPDIDNALKASNISKENRWGKKQQNNERD